MRVGAAFQVTSLPAARSAALYLRPEGTGGIKIPAEAIVADLHPKFDNSKVERCLSNLLRSVAWPKQRSKVSRHNYSLFRYSSKKFQKIARHAQLDKSTMVQFYYDQKHAQKRSAKLYNGACCSCARKLSSQNDAAGNHTETPSTTCTTQSETFVPSTPLSSAALGALGCQQGTFGPTGVHGSTQIGAEQQDPMLESFTELWGSAGMPNWPLVSPGSSPAAVSPKKAGPTKLRSILLDGDLVVSLRRWHTIKAALNSLQTYRAHTHLRARFDAPLNSFSCLSACCEASSASGLTLSGLERHWGRGKARKAWSNTLLVNQDRTSKMMSLQQLIQKHEPASMVQAAPKDAAKSLPSSRVILSSTHAALTAALETGIFLKRTMCSMPGCSQCICFDCRPPSKSNTVKRHFWACHACRIRLGLPTATREVAQVANASTRSKRVSYAPPRFEDWIEQHEAEVSIRKKTDMLDEAHVHSEALIGRNQSVSAPSLPSLNSVCEAALPPSPANPLIVKRKAESAQVKDADCKKILIPVDKPRKQYMQPKAIALSKEARKAERKNRRKRRREQDADQVSDKWTSKGVGNFTWLPHLAPKQVKTPQAPKPGFVLTAQLPRSLLLNPFHNPWSGQLESHHHNIGAGDASRSGKQRRISIKSRGAVCATASVNLSNQCRPEETVCWDVHTVEVHEAIRHAQVGIRVHHSAFVDLSCFM